MFHSLFNILWRIMFNGLIEVSDFPEFFKKDEINEFWETFYEILSYVDDRCYKGFSNYQRENFS